MEGFVSGNAYVGHDLDVVPRDKSQTYGRFCDQGCQGTARPRRCPEGQLSSRAGSTSHTKSRNQSMGEGFPHLTGDSCFRRGSLSRPVFIAN